MLYSATMPTEDAPYHLQGYGEDRPHLGTTVFYTDDSAIVQMAIDAGWVLTIDGAVYRSRLESLVHPTLRRRPMLTLDFRDFPGTLTEKVVEVCTWGTGASAGDKVSRQLFLDSQTTTDALGRPVALPGEEPFAVDVSFEYVEGLSGPSHRTVSGRLLAEDGSIFAEYTVPKTYAGQASSLKGADRRKRVWWEILHLDVLPHLMSEPYSMTAAEAGIAGASLLSFIGLDAKESFLGDTAYAQPLRDGLDEASASISWVTADLVSAITARLVRWP